LDASGIDRTTKQFTAEEFAKVLRRSNFVGAVVFWRALERLAAPDPHTRLHAMGLLRELAGRAFDDCLGFAFSPQEAECFRYCGLMPRGVRTQDTRHPVQSSE
jgi:hypothetical protein